MGGGGRYDGLSKQLGGPDVPAFGFGAGLERLIQVMLAQQVGFAPRGVPTLTVLPMGDRARRFGFDLCTRLRRSGIAATCDWTGRKLKSMLSHAAESGARYVAILGDRELDEGSCPVRCMETREETVIPLAQLELYLQGV
jgi:histidyl-tRNA synthetase